MNWPTVIYNEEVMREGFGIENVGIRMLEKIIGRPAFGHV